MKDNSDPVEEYLDELLAGLRGVPRQARLILAEAEDHLGEAVEAGLAAGLSRREAQEAAISSFGSVRAVVRAHDQRLRRRPGLAVAGELVMAGWLLAWVGLLAIGVSEGLAAIMTAAFGRQYMGVAGSGTGWVTHCPMVMLANGVPSDNCSHATLTQLVHSDAVLLRELAGLAGLVLMVFYFFARQYWRRNVLPAGFAATAGVALFGLAGLALIWMAIGGGPAAHAGPGFYLSGALVSLAVAAIFVPMLHRALLRQASAG